MPFTPQAASPTTSQTLRCRIRHSIPGRIRLRIQPAGKLREAQMRCLALEGVLSARANPACASLIVLYNTSQTKQDSIIAALRATAPTCAAFPPATGVSSSPCASSASSCACAPPAVSARNKNHFLQFLIFSGAMGAVAIKRFVLKAALAQALLSPLGLFSLTSSLLLLKKSFAHTGEKRLTLETFLASGCIAATFAGQALTALEILWVHSGAESLNHWIAERSRRSVSTILDLTTKSTFILAGDVEVEMPVSGVKPRDIVVLHTDEKICVDGEILSGEALVDESPITGRAEAIHKAKGDKIHAGGYVLQGLIHVRAESVGDHTYLARIMRQVEDSLENKAPVESVADQLAERLLRIGLAATAGAFLLTGSLWRAFTVLLVMACPCATSLSAKTAVSAAIATAARRGILIKGGRYLEAVGKADVVCFDKTGTLTSNEPRIERIINYSSLPENELLLWAYSAEMHNQHPLARAIQKEALARGIDPVAHLECDFTLGRGVRAVFGKDVIRLGNRRYLQDAGIALGPEINDALALRNKGLTVIFLAKNADLLAAFAFANEARPEAKHILKVLRNSGVSKITMITGDSKSTALRFCAEMGVEECHYSVLPEEKGHIVSQLRKNGSTVVMVGDGINDALALAEADIGIAMSAAGSDVAIEAADIALVKDDLADILFLRSLSNATMRIARQNFWLATGTNLGGALAGALGLLSPVAAGVLHIAHTLGVLANSSRLLLPAPPANERTRKDDSRLCAAPQKMHIA